MQRTQRSFIMNVKERKERSVLFIKNAQNARTLRSFEKNAKECKNVGTFAQPWLQVLKEEMEYRIIKVYETAFYCFIASQANAAAGATGGDGIPKNQSS